MLAKWAACHRELVPPQASWRWTVACRDLNLRTDSIEAVRRRSGSDLPELARTCKTVRNRRPQSAPTGDWVGKPTPFFRGRRRYAVIASCLSRRDQASHSHAIPHVSESQMSKALPTDRASCAETAPDGGVL